jgi:molecular chaperone HtpG
VYRRTLIMSTTENAGSAGSTETFAFQAEINQLMSLIINTFYSNKEIFLRELVSNASDALDKIRYKSLQESSVLDAQKELFIHIVPDKANKTLSIIDSGIGMTRDDLITFLGTIAQSGTKSFMEKIKNGEDVSCIGQFGVGFYSAYLVADHVSVTSKHNDDDQYVWESNAGGTFTVRKDLPDAEQLMRGTKITIHLKDDYLQYLEESQLRSLLKKHSEFINYPISLQIQKTVEREIEDADADEKKPDESGEPVIEEVKDDDEQSKQSKPKKTKTVSDVVYSWDVTNKNKPIWTRTPDTVSNDEYIAFYKSLSNDWDEPILHKHFAVEGQLEFKSVIYIPKRSSDMFSQSLKKKFNLKLYVRRVFIMDGTDELCPDWLSFIHGVVDSEDLPLNISREILQQNKIMKIMKKNIIKKCIELFEELAENEDKYKPFYEQFGKNIKLGIHEDEQNRERLLPLLRFQSTTHLSGLGTSLKDYVSRMKESQPGIFYISGESIAALENAPFLEKLKRKGYEVLYFVDPMDEYMVQIVKEFEGKKILSATKDGIPFDLDDDFEFDQLKKKTEELCIQFKNILGSAVEKVVCSNRLVESPCCIVTAEYGWSANMERIMKAQALGDASVRQYMNAKKILEINPAHLIIQHMRENDENSNKDFVWMLYESSLISSGFTLDEPHAYIKRIYTIIESGLSTDKFIDEDVITPAEEISTDIAAVASSVEDVIITPAEEISTDIAAVASTVEDVVITPAEEISTDIAAVASTVEDVVITPAEETINC